MRRFDVHQRVLCLSSTLALACAAGGADDGGFSTFTTASDGPGDGDGDPAETGEESADTTTDTDDTGPSTCGDGHVDADEECDLGSENSASGQCTPECLIADCGDGYTYEGFEECDDGNAIDTDDCVAGCKLATCGDGLVQAGVEECDDGNDDDSDGCTSMCVPAVCGDGIVQAGEQCDDGNRDTADGCPDCQLSYCGDGFVEAGVEECDDGNMIDTDDCVSVFCTPASCGDGFVWDGVEICDDGNLDDGDQCPTSCEPAYCGDDFVQAGVEQCDDGNNVSSDGCSAMCISENKRVFVSSQMYDGNLGGLAGADQKCQQLADAANLAGTFMAWISTNEGSPSTRFTQSNTPYILVDGTQIAPNWAGLVDGSLDAPINKTETGGPAPIGDTSCAGGGFPTVWSATNPQGTYSNTACNDFTSNAGSGLWGHAGETTSSWSSWCSGGVCSWVSPIYCFQQ